jgi:hypothetical protein
MKNQKERRKKISVVFDELLVTESGFDFVPSISFSLVCFHFHSPILKNQKSFLFFNVLVIKSV